MEESSLLVKDAGPPPTTVKRYSISGTEELDRGRGADRWGVADCTE
jgi:hypothetical protein